MSAAAEPPLPQPSLDLLEESRIWGWDGSSWTEVSVDSNGQIQTAISDALQSEAADEVRTRVFGPDAGGTLQQVLAEQFDTALATTDVGLATYGDRALRSLNQDELNSVILGVNQGGSLQEVGVEAFNSAAAAGGFALLTYGDRALQTQAADEHRARLFQDDAGGALRQVLAEQLDTAVANTDVGLLTYSGRALQTSGQDELRARMFNTSGTNIDPATTALENALQANAADEYRSRLFGLDAGGVLQHVNAEEFGTALATTDVGLATYSARALASLAQDEVRVEHPEADVLTDSSVGGGAVDAVSLDLGDVITDFDVVFDLSAVNADVVVEVSTSGAFAGEEHEHTRIAQADLSTGDNFEQFGTTFQHVRAFYEGVDADVTEIEISAKGVS